LNSPFPALSPTTTVERVLLWILVGFTVAAVGGFWIFGVHPERIAANAMAARVYGAAFVVFARGQVLLAAAALITVLVRRTRGAWIPAFLAIYLLSLSSELAGTTVGLPFGPYHYTDGLGPKWFDHVPLLIPLSWFLMAVPSFAIARRLVGRSSSIARIRSPTRTGGSRSRSASIARGRRRSPPGRRPRAW